MKSLLRCALVVVALGITAAAPPADCTARVKVLLRKLDADSFHTRQKADARLRAMGKVVVPLLRAELLRTTSLEVRHRVARIVEHLTFDERIPGLVEMLGHSNAQFGAQAEYALLQAGPSVVPLLRKELRPTLDTARRQRLEKIIAELSLPDR
jgi:HEAT repeat protein